MERNSQEKQDLKVSDILLSDAISTAASQAMIHEQDNALSQLKVKTFCSRLSQMFSTFGKEDLHIHAASSGKLEALQLEHRMLQEKVKNLEVVLDRSSQEKRDLQAKRASECDAFHVRIKELEVGGPFPSDAILNAALKATIHEKDNSLLQLKVKTFYSGL